MKKIAIIQFKQIGDVLITASLFKSLRNLYPDSQLDYIVYDYTVGVVENNPYIDNVIIINSEERNNPLKLISKFNKIKKNNYDYVIDIIGDMKSAFLTYIIGAEHKIINKNNKKRNKWFYNKRIENTEANVCKYRNYVVEGIEKGNFDKIVDDLEVKIFLEENEIKKLKKRMLEKNVNFNRPVAAFGTNSRREYKKWDIDYFTKLINFLIEKYDMQIVLYNSPNEREYAELVKSKLIKKENVFTDIYTENIKDLAALLKNCDMFVGNEGGPRHIAEAVGTPTFSIAYITHNEEDWILNSKTWGITNRMVQIDDYLNLSSKEFSELKNSIKRDREKEMREFKKLKPDFVIEQVEKMLKDLRAKKEFRSDIAWLN